MNRIRIAASFVTLTLLWASPALANDAALKRTEALLAAFKKVKTPGKSGLSKADVEANAKIFSEIDGYFDFDHLTREPIRPNLKKFSKGQADEFSTIFREVVRLNAYPDSGDFLRSAQTKLRPAKGKKGIVTELHAYLEEDDIETTVHFYWKKKDGNLVIRDVSFDGASLVRDYTNQFGRIIKKDGVAGLLTKVRNRRETERKNYYGANS